MRRPPRRSTPAAIGLATALLLAACTGGGTDSDQLPSTERQARGVQDMNAQDPAVLRDGGDLRLPLETLPDNWNHNHVDGTDGEARMIQSELLPRAFDDGPEGPPVLNADLLTGAVLTSSAPQVLTYDINPDATWRSGRPITWEDFDAQVTALGGRNPRFEASSTTGYDQIATVAPGTSDKQVVVTFGSVFAEWESLFTPLYPKETNADPAVFNDGWLTSVPDSAGPFQVDTIDTASRTVTLVCNPGTRSAPRSACSNGPAARPA